MAQLRVNGSRLGRDCRGEACLARRVRRTRIVILRLFIPKHHLSVIAGEEYTY